MTCQMASFVWKYTELEADTLVNRKKLLNTVLILVIFDPGGQFCQAS